ncbi:hypothetical protein [Nitrososphaera sp.]|uniref:hypothetical protein n=1 Tax=Nitrososphaera sp. TaxID=1971748 RepID=UPI00307F8AB2
MTAHWIEKALESAPWVVAARDRRVAELREIRSKVRSDPEEVEAWLDREIEKLSDIPGFLKKDATAGI